MLGGFWITYLQKLNFLYQVYEVEHNFSINITKDKEKYLYFFLVLSTNEHRVTGCCYIIFEELFCWRRELGQASPQVTQHSLHPWQIKKITSSNTSQSLHSYLGMETGGWIINWNTHTHAILPPIAVLSGILLKNSFTALLTQTSQAHIWSIGLVCD